MHYLSRILNEYQMFPRLATVLHDKNTDPNLKIKIERFLYRATCALTSSLAIYNAEMTSVRLVKAYQKQLKLPKGSKRIALSTEPLFDAYSQIPSALSSIVIMQNLILPLVCAIENVKVSTPKSLNEAMKKGIHKYGLQSSVADSILEYWNNKDGKYVRDVRNINEHFDALVDQTFFELENEPGQLLIFLPDNPETKSPKQFIYKNEKDAHDTINSGINNLNWLMENICGQLGIGPKSHTNSMLLEHMGDLAEPQERTLGLMISITKINKTDQGNHAELDTIEMMQVIPEKEGAGNLALRKLKTDEEMGLN